MDLKCCKYVDKNLERNKTKLKGMSPIQYQTHTQSATNEITRA
ncbi:IS3 family transposase [Lysinibacillus sphaericus]